MLAPRSFRRAATVIAALMLLTLVGVTHESGRPSTVTPSAASEGVNPALSVLPHLTSNANLFVNDSAPSGAFPAGETVTVVYSIQVVGAPAGAVGTKVDIPSAVVQLPATSSAVRLYPRAVEVTIGPNGSVWATPGAGTLISSPITFNTTGNAFLSTYGVAVMASWPYGQYTIQFQWRWVLVAADGASTTGPWSNPVSVLPALLAKFAVPPQSSWVKGAPYALCLTGPIVGRTFSVHVYISNPLQQFDDGPVTVSSSAAVPFCWNSTLPNNVHPQQASIHLWEYSNVTFLLYVLPVQIVNATQTPVRDGVAAATVGWLPFALGGGIVAVAVTVVGLILLFTQHRFHRRPPRSPDGVASAQTPPSTPAELPVRSDESAAVVTPSRLDRHSPRTDHRWGDPALFPRDPGPGAAGVAPGRSPRRLPPSQPSRPRTPSRRVIRPMIDMSLLAGHREKVGTLDDETRADPLEPEDPTSNGILSTGIHATALWSVDHRADELRVDQPEHPIPERVSAGTPRLNDLLRGGLPLNTHVMLVGDLFLGKEVALYSFIAEGLRLGEPALLVTATRGPEEVRLQLIDVFPAFEEYERNGCVQWIDASGPSGDDGTAGPVPGAVVVKGPDDYSGILMALLLAANRANANHPGQLRVGFLGLGAAFSPGRERAGFAFLQNFVGILKRRAAVAMYAVEGGTLTDADLERLLARMDGAIRFKREQNKTFLSVVGIGDVATRNWVEYRATNRTLTIGSFSLERIR